MLNRKLQFDKTASRPGADRWQDDEDRSWSLGFLSPFESSPLDVIIGTSGDDSLRGSVGDDTIDGLQGADRMLGRLGNDTYIVDDTGDTVVEKAHHGHDLVMASVSFTLGENVEHMTLTGGDDINATGNATNNRLTGNAGANALDGKEGADTLTGGAGNDIYYVDDAGDVVKEHAGEGTDTVRTSIDYTLGQYEENLQLWPSMPVGLVGTGNGLANLIEDSAGDDVLYGMGGNDTIDGGSVMSPGHADTLYGGGGDDLITGGLHNYSADDLYGGMGDDTLQVAYGANGLYGEDGNDLLVAGGGGMYHGPADHLDGGNGNDTLQGGSSASGGAGSDLIECYGSTGGAYGGAGNDTISGVGGGGYIDFYADGDEGNDQMNVGSFNNDLFATGGSGNDTISGYGYATVSIDGGAGDDEINGIKYAPARMDLSGGDGNDSITAHGSGSGNGVTVSGGRGNDHIALTGLVGTEIEVHGDGGSDTLQVEGGMASLWGGVGADLFVLSTKEELGYNMMDVQDFRSGVDQLGLSQATLAVGNGDLVVDDAVAITGPGGFDTSSELVIVAADIFGELSLGAAAAAIGSADQSYADGQSAVFTVTNGADSWVLYFESDGADAAVSAAELSIVARLQGTGSTAAEDISWSS